MPRQYCELLTCRDKLKEGQWYVTFIFSHHKIASFFNEIMPLDSARRVQKQLNTAFEAGQREALEAMQALANRTVKAEDHCPREEEITSV